MKKNMSAQAEMHHNEKDHST